MPVGHHKHVLDSKGTWLGCTWPGVHGEGNKLFTWSPRTEAKADKAPSPLPPRHPRRLDLPEPWVVFLVSVRP